MLRFDSKIRVNRFSRLNLAFSIQNLEFYLPVLSNLFVSGADHRLSPWLITVLLLAFRI